MSMKAGKWCQRLGFVDFRGGALVLFLLCVIVRRAAVGLPPSCELSAWGLAKRIMSSRLQGDPVSK